VVAIIDTGVDPNHPALAEHLWVNPGESGVDALGKSKSSNGIDDDSNGFVDDVHGWNFANNTNQIADSHGHGTHIAGIIAGSAPKAKMMILKYFNPNALGEVNQQNTLRAIEYAIQMKARIINYSAGGTDSSTKEEAAIAKAGAENILFVAAAGNERANSDYQGFYPASYNLPNIVSVTAVDSLQTILPSSNYGRNSVDLAAPGKSILSTIPGGKKAVMTGTSQATAFVSGTAALLMAENPELRTPEALIPYLTMTGTVSEQLSGKTKTSSFLNSYQSLVMKGSDLSAFGQRAINAQRFTERFSETDVADELPFHTAGSEIKIAPRP
jgi:subtilisin family serine protease